MPGVSVTGPGVGARTRPPGGRAGSGADVATRVAVVLVWRWCSCGGARVAGLLEWRDCSGSGMPERRVPPERRASGGRPDVVAEGRRSRWVRAVADRVT